VESSGPKICSHNLLTSVAHSNTRVLFWDEFAVFVAKSQTGDESMAEPQKPGAIINRDILNAHQMKQADLARALGISDVRIHFLVTGRARITPEVALRLAKVTSTDPAYWLQLQMDYDLVVAARKLSNILERLVPISYSRATDIGAGWSSQGLQTAL
jgi:addiction module HigA family antidote